MTGRWCRVCVLAASVVWALPPAVLWAQGPATGAQSAPASAPANAGATTAEASRHRQAGIDDALAGRFEKARTRFRRAVDIASEDPANKRCLALLEAYMAHRRTDEAMRVREYANAVRRLRQCMLAQRYLPEPTEADLAREKPPADVVEGEIPVVPSPEGKSPKEPESRPATATPNQERWDARLRKHVRQAVKAHDKTPDRQSVDLATTEELADMKTTSRTALKEAAIALDKAVAVLAKDQSQYARTFRASADRAGEALKKHQSLWATVSGKSPKAQRQGAHDLFLDELDVLMALREVESLVAVKPWRYALLFGRSARELATDKKKVAEEQWHRTLVADLKLRAEQALRKARDETNGSDAARETAWYDALAAYAALKDLMPKNKAYRQKTKIVRRHVRVLNLYGRKTPDPEKKAKGEKGGKTWRDIVAKIDEKMIRKAIFRVDRHYVTTVDYGKLIRGGVMSVKVLVETPQARRAFPKLKSPSVRKDILKTVQAEFDCVRNGQPLHKEDLELALSNLVTVCEKEDRIPVSVVAMEFADGFLNELDRFSSMIWPDEVEEFNKQTMGRFFGIGVQINKQLNGPLKVVTPLAQSPAMKAGIKAGDSIIAVDDPKTDKGMQPTAELTITACVKLIMGEKGTKVTLRIRRNGVDKPIDTDVIRGEIHIRTVSGWRPLDGGRYGTWDYLVDPGAKIAYVRIKQFTDKTAGHVVGVLEELADRNVRSLVLDLRNDPGGLLRAATDVTDQFIRRGKIVTTKERSETRAPFRRAGRSGKYLAGDLVVLVNTRSASAAEIVSGALKELRHCTIVGERTFGKGSVQHVIPIPDHKAFLKLTTARYFVGDRQKAVHREDGADEDDKNWGVIPHIDAKLSRRQNIELNMLWRKNAVIRDRVDPKQLREGMARQYAADVQLQTGVLLLNLMKLRESAGPISPIAGTPQRRSAEQH